MTRHPIIACGELNRHFDSVFALQRKLAAINKRCELIETRARALLDRLPEIEEKICPPLPIEGTPEYRLLRSAAYSAATKEVFKNDDWDEAAVDEALKHIELEMGRIWYKRHMG